MIRTTGSTGSDGKTIVWFFIIGYTVNSYYMPPVNSHLNRKGAKTFFYNMIQREKRLYEEREKNLAYIKKVRMSTL